MIIIPKLCLECVHLFGPPTFRCKAFPKGIPDKVLNVVTHYPDQPFRGDNGIRFEPIDGRPIKDWKKKVPPLTEDDYQNLAEEPVDIDLL